MKCIFYERGELGVPFVELYKSVPEQVEQAEEDCTKDITVYTMSTFYVQALCLYADKAGVLDKWSFYIQHKNGTLEDVTDNRTKMHKIVADVIDKFFEVK